MDLFQLYKNQSTILDTIFYRKSLELTCFEFLLDGPNNNQDVEVIFYYL